MSHIDRTLTNIDDVLKLAATGCVIEYDFFGIETSYYWFNDTDLQTDYMRLGCIRSLIDHGHIRQIVVSHDICTKHRLVRYGGHGYGYIPEHIIPRMRNKNFDESEIKAITEKNPARLLTIN